MCLIMYTMMFYNLSSSPAWKSYPLLRRFTPSVTLYPGPQCFESDMMHPGQNTLRLPLQGALTGPEFGDRETRHGNYGECGDPILQSKVSLPSRITGAGGEGNPWSFLPTKCRQELPWPLFALLGRRLHRQWEMRSAGWRETLPGSLLNPIIYISLNPIKLATHHTEMAKEGLCQAVLIQ